jgi:hypothetical protein
MLTALLDGLFILIFMMSIFYGIPGIICGIQHLYFEYTYKKSHRDISPDKGA